MADIFVSYASDDRDRVQSLVEALEAEGWTVWWDRVYWLRKFLRFRTTLIPHPPIVTAFELNARKWIASKPQPEVLTQVLGIVYRAISTFITRRGAARNHWQQTLYRS